jgi:uncharacterized membrane protein (DUF485 family)
MADGVGFVVNIVEVGQGFSPNGCFPRQYYSNNAPYSLIHPPPTPYNAFLRALQFSPVSIILPLLHTHSFIYHPCCILFFSQYFSFPLSVSFHHCYIHIHSSTTHTILFFSQYFSFPLSVSFHHCSIHIHSSTTHTKLFFSQYFSFPLSVSFHHCSVWAERRMLGR